MIYTCYDMIRDCREGREQGWSYFIANYVPVIRRIVGRYAEQPGDAVVEAVLVSLREPASSLFQSQDPSPERWFVAEMRQQVLGVLDRMRSSAAEAALELPLLSEALQPLTAVEKQATWLETMHYDPKEAATLLRMEPRTIEKIRDRAAELLRAKLDTWNRTLLQDHGRSLGRLAALAGTPQCPPVKNFLNVLDGRSTWGQREELEGHVIACWHCVDHFCRMAEVVELVRDSQPLPAEESAKYRAVLGIGAPKKKFWRGWTAAR